MIQKINLLILIGVFVLCSCEKKESIDVEIILKKYNLHLQSEPDSDSSLPPSYNMIFYMKNDSKQDITFISKSSQYDKTKSNLYLLDTLKNVIIPIYSGSRDILKSNSSCEINATIDIRQFRKYFNLKDSFFNKFDYTSDKLMLNKIFISMLNRSIIIYEQDSSDVSNYKILNENVKPLPSDKLIKINKDNFSNY